MSNENGAAILRVLFWLATMSSLLCSPLVMASQISQGSMAKTNIENAAAENESRAVPPIDRAAPTTYKTATFGLG